MNKDDWGHLENAERLASKINAYWRGYGVAARARAVMLAGGKTPVYGVASHLTGEEQGGPFIGHHLVSAPP